MQKLFTAREKTIFYLTILVVIFSVVFNFLIAPFWEKNDSLNKEINFTRAKVKRYIWLLAQSESIKNKAKDFPSVINAGKQEDGSVVLLSELESLAKDANIRIIDVRPASDIKGRGANKEMLVDLRAEGSTEDYLKFIYNLENSLSLLKIKKFQLTAKANGQALEGNFSILGSGF